MKLYLIPAILFYCLSFLSQSAYKFPEKFSSSYNFHPEAALQQLTQEKDEDRKRAVEKYLVSHIYAEQFMFDYNNVYMNWNEAEVYMLRILDTLFNKKERSQRLDIFLRRSFSANATASRYGNVFFNIGMFCEAEDEAFLASVIAHEAGHYFLGHKVKELAMREKTFKYSIPDYAEYEKFLKAFQKHELQSDSFSFANTKKLNLNLESTMKWHESADAQSDVIQNARSYKNMLKASAISDADLKKKKGQKYNAFGSHPSNLQRYDNIRKEMKACTSCKKKFLIDSVFFFKLKKIAMEERKKLAFERCDYNSCMRFSFVDYLYKPKNPKNLYFLVESIRRLLYMKPDLSNFGFLTEEIDDTELLLSKSILHKPDYLYSSIKEYEDLKNHPFLINEEKPFRSYAEAFIYLSNEAVRSGLNEANFSLALYYHSTAKRDSAEKYFNRYISNGNGQSIELAKELLANKTPKIKKGKTLMVYNSIGNYTGGDFNYYMALKKRESNSFVRKELLSDTSKMDLVIMNELLGAYPQKLNRMSSLLNHIANLYDDDDIEMCKKVRLTSHFANENAAIPNKFKKHLLLLAPEWYGWLKENNYDKIFYIDMIYQYKGYMDEEEYYNNYIGYYLDLNDTRPYFKDPVRNGYKRKQKEEEMFNDINVFLYD